jgi:hypothetical protein
MSGSLGARCALKHEQLRKMGRFMAVETTTHVLRDDSAMRAESENCDMQSLWILALYVHAQYRGRRGPIEGGLGNFTLAQKW